MRYGRQKKTKKTMAKIVFAKSFVVIVEI
jgi:hypothetical protein